ncbi:MAG: hypothetical protein U9P11_05980 [Pseudomonadota bacterium]|nr:hypothetical protein [Pseudomonadota bacterium]
MKKCKFFATALAAGMITLAGGAVAHDPASSPGTPVCLESNLMAADAQNEPFSNAPGPGRVIEMNTTTGERGITVNRPFNTDNIGTPICDNGGVDCPGPWKPTGVLSGGEDGHAIITSAAQHAHTTFHRDGTPIKTGPTLPTSPSPDGGNFGFVPRLLGSGYMPNGNIAQTVCDANFFNAANSDPIEDGEMDVQGDGNSSWQFFPPVYSTATRGDNGRVLVVDQTTLEVVDEYSKPMSGAYANDPRWNCPAGVIFTSEGLYVSMFHGDAVFVIDWKAGIDNEKSEGVGSNNPSSFELDRPGNEAVVIRVIDLSDNGSGIPDAPDYDSGNRRDNLRAIRMSEDGTLWGTRRGRSKECLRGQAPGVTDPPGDVVCNPSVFRQHIFAAGPGEDHRTGSLALDPGVNVIAGVTINRMSGPGCKFVQEEITGGKKKNEDLLTGDECDVETLYVGVSAGNAGCDADGDGNNGPGHPANQCFVPGGTIYEYRIDAAHLDGAGGLPCTGDPADGYGPGEGNEGCAMPIAQFDFLSDGVTSGLPAGTVETLDPRMVMTIHEAFTQ